MAKWQDQRLIALIKFFSNLLRCCGPPAVQTLCIPGRFVAGVAITGAAAGGSGGLDNANGSNAVSFWSRADGSEFAEEAQGPDFTGALRTLDWLDAEWKALGPPLGAPIGAAKGGNFKFEAAALKFPSLAAAFSALSLITIYMHTHTWTLLLCEGLAAEFMLKKKNG